jgi:hypothetical protein
MMVWMRLQRIPGIITTPGDIDRAPLSYSVEIIHLLCMTVGNLIRLILPGSTQSSFQPTVYFHPNVRTDGWDNIISFHKTMRGVYDEEGKAEKDKGKAKKRGNGKGKGKGKGKDEKKSKIKVRPSFPDLPPHPRFWDLGVRGSEVKLWPPRLFDDWIEGVARGCVLGLEPVSCNTGIGGPSNISPPSPSSSLLTSPPSTPPRTSAPSNIPSPSMAAQESTQLLPSPPGNTPLEPPPYKNYETLEELEAQMIQYDD